MQAEVDDKHKLIVASEVVVIPISRPSRVSDETKIRLPPQ